MNFIRILSILSLLVMVSFGSAAQTANLSQEQIQRFKNMSPQQRQMLANQLGIDLSSLEQMGQSGLSGMNRDNGLNTQQQIYPRGTQFDEFGNPLTPEEQRAREEQEKEEEDELKPYGYELFANAPSTFTPTSNIPVPANYIVGPGDQLLVQLYGKENQEYQLEVSRDGSVVVPKLGPITVAGKSFSELKSYMADVIKRQIIGVEVSVTMGELRTMRVFVMGEAYKPGAYNVSSLSTITHALFVSGGVTEIASLRNIQLKRAGELVQTLDLYDLLNNGDASKDALLQPGDVVFIPAVNKTVTVDGLVRRPAIYELKHEESLSQVIELAGGKLPRGYAGAVSVKRYQAGVQVQLTVDLSSEDIKVQAGDEIEIAQVVPRIANSVSLIGAVARPGNYQWYEGQRVSSLLGDTRKSLLETADLNYLLILREQNENGDLNVLQTDLTLLGEDPQADLLLKPNDKILVFSRIESEAISDIRLDDLAFTNEQLKENEKEKWEKRIEEKLFWKQLGLEESPAQSSSFDDEEIQLLASQTLIELTEEEKEKILELKDTTYYSRKRMLTPVIAKLREQAKLGEPLQLVEVVGEVKVPGVYPLPQNATVLKLMKAAGGLTESSYGLKSEITRTIINDKGVAEVTHLNFSPADVLANDQDDNIALKSKDRVNIFTIPSWQEDLRVTVKGEVEFPGEYTIRRGETLSDLLERVGGLTNYSEPAAAIFTRESLKERERENLVRLAEELRKQIASESLRRQTGAGAVVSYDQAKNLLRDLTKVEPVGRLVIDLQAVINGQKTSDVTLEDGDALYIPGKTQSVNVIGEVYVPTSHLYTAGLDYEQYILRSGGFKELAADDKTYIIHADGSVSVPGRDSGFWFSSGTQETGIKPGDTIVVPFNSDYVDNMTLWTNATQIIYQLAVSIAAISSL
ncbi:SLBB domain-containing protein [Bowmanella dokdonensis]|uniref:SLBB domain-containing protein n=1 Tax=Bowmanella dokdonensis TaxID=751969 RepID=A0A939IT89_9ALTE|nr:SLBB domain-containing protein [Bowmanella dokdonensis]MBN7827537.1 SLBB domain-containing protein [Bowmanella dokdonensis]